jgi:lambda family phage minor tail protein L
MSIADDIRALAPDALVELFELDATGIGGPLLRFHAGTNALGGSVVWQGNAYQPYPVQAEGFEWSGRGTLPRPKLTVSNVGGLVGAYVLQYQDLLGAKVTRRRTLAKYLDAVNFPGGVNPSADPTQALPDEVYFIDQKSSETPEAIIFELAPSFDVRNVFLPGRQVLQTCAWVYRGAECGWVPGGSGPYYDAGDAVTDAAHDQCGKRLTSCKLRFGGGNPLPFGGFPAAGRTRL